MELFIQIHNAQTEGQWTRIAEIKSRSGMSQAEIDEGIRWAMENVEDFRAEPEPFGHRITEADRAAAVMIGGEYRHLIKIGE